MTEVEILWEKYVAICDIDKKAFTEYMRAHKKTSRILRVHGAISSEFRGARLIEEKLEIRQQAVAEAREMFFNKWHEASLAERRAESNTTEKED